MTPIKRTDDVHACSVPLFFLFHEIIYAAGAQHHRYVRLLLHTDDLHYEKSKRPTYVKNKQVTRCYHNCHLVTEQQAEMSYSTVQLRRLARFIV